MTVARVRCDLKRRSRSLGTRFRAAADEAVEALGVQAFIFKQLLGNQFELSVVFLKDRFGLSVGLIEQALYLFVDLLCRAFAAVTLKRAVDSRPMRSIRTLSTAHQPDRFAH